MDLTLRSWEKRKWSPIGEAVDCCTNSPFQYHRKCICTINHAEYEYAGKHTWPWCIWLVERVAHFLRPITEQRKKKLVHSHFVFTNQLQIIISTPYVPCFTFACDVIHQVQDANGTSRGGGLGMIYSWGKKKDISFGGSRLFQLSSNCKAKRTCYYIRCVSLFCLILLILVYIKAPSLATPKQVKTANKT